MVAATIRTIFAQPNGPKVREQLDNVADLLAGEFPAVAQLLCDAKADLTAFADFPLAHWQKIWSTNPLERLNREVKRRTDVVVIFPNTDSLLRLSACVLIEAHDEWQDSDRRYLSEGSMALLNPPAPTALEAKTTPPAKTTRRRIAATA
jgi:putative transposase